ncbi:MAG: trehalose-phosphatase [Rhodospirillales bacterium]|nr:trehalose-phosphatase [Rhodospirillales bacterium]
MSHVSIPLHEAALFLDLDGTLAPIADRPEDVGPSLWRNGLLRRLDRALQGRLAIVSGRQLDDIDRILDDSVLCVAGVHGLERRNSFGKLQSAEAHPQLDRVYTILESYVATRPDLHLEFKTLGVALHYRQAPAAAAEVLTVARRLAWATGMKLQEGRMVVELRSPGADKGDTVRAFMLEPLFQGAIPIFVGDDITDEDGFAAVQDLAGAGVLVGAPRETRAIARLDGVGDVLAWIKSSIDTGFFELDRR